MATRRPHRKSRLGCKTCKKRRVKCDEIGPPCGPCQSRSIPCEYASTQPAIPTPPDTPGVDGQAHISRNAIQTEWSEPRRLLEMELLHQWSTVTYKSYCGTVTEEYHNWQVVVPQLALNHDYLLHGMLAMSALEIAAFSETDFEVCNHYVNVALEYHNLASCGLRRELANVTSDNRQALFALSSILMIMGLALPRFTSLREEHDNMLDHLMTYLALLKGLRLICDSEKDFRHKDPLMRGYQKWDDLPCQKLEPAVQLALRNIVEANEELNGAARTNSTKTELEAMTCHAACRKAIFFLEEDFKKSRDPHTRAYALGWPLRAGPDYVSAITQREPVTLLVLLAWGVLLEQISHDIWWMDSFGKRLIEHVSDVIDISTNDRLSEGVRWARKEIDLEEVLDPFADCMWVKMPLD